MIKVLIYGCGGHMGKVVRDIISETAGVVTAAGVDPFYSGKEEYPVFASLDDCHEEVDAVIDFSSSAAVDSVLDYVAEHGIPLVECTTGLSQEQIDKISRAAEKTAILRSANMSLGVNALMKLLRQAVAVFDGRGFDIEILEKHHRRKLDAPSGTALALADTINEAAGNKYTYIYDKSQRRQARADDEIGISAIRGGTIVGEHDVIFAGTDEVIELKHTAFSRAIFAKGAVAAAIYLADKAPGLYDMSHVIDG